ncbi:hypothetical protein HDA32_000119 [Spinactinospora alkalitolerans]|uniref:Terminase small subunit n=1 Tax=Spinactinospora alkalitolerans TaxID=687207 RepID=A0A852TM18_9ACTN|nr:hypothetical protein [Spinactinospora alkalitolerans]NYE44999.1 hypothetical protein [Spinactinospora alkalitolerans]
MDEAPKHLGVSGRALYRDVCEDWELNAAEHGLLVRLCETADVLDRLVAEMHNAPVTTLDGRVSPVITEFRQMAQAYARIAAALRLPEGADETRPQRRGMRGTYGVRKAVAG